tara:strand:- start:46 stop:531 length:486 start_codon:yes stop_codon:yes gene_type:complete
MTYIKSDNPICDYIQLHFQDATIQGTKMTWNIPNVYYSNLNSPVCTVVLEEAAVSTSQNLNLLVKWLGSVQNGFNTRNSGIVLSHLFRMFDGGVSTNYCNNYPSDVKVLTTARPQSITLEIIEANDSPILIDSSAVFVLKFEYYDYKAVTNGLINSSYPIL